jgi:hypothetical protein
MADASIPFRVQLPDAQIDDLRARLARTRWQPEAFVREVRAGFRAMR